MQLPEDEWETYGKGQHLRGADAVFADQVLDELVRGLPSACGLLKHSAFLSLLMVRVHLSHSC